MLGLDETAIDEAVEELVDGVKAALIDAMNAVFREREKPARDKLKAAVKIEIEDAVAAERDRILEAVIDFMAEPPVLGERGYVVGRDHGADGITPYMLEAIVRDDAAWQKRIRTL